jgi:membrane protease YdiL (CAAX protease family)
MSNILHVKQGWIRALLFFFVGVIVSGSIASPIHTFIEEGGLGGTHTVNQSLLDVFLFYVINYIGILLCLWYFRTKIDGESIFTLGFKWSGFSKDALLGGGVAMLIIGVGTTLLFIGDNLKIYRVNFNILNLLVSTLLFILVAFVEEVVIRGYVLTNLMEDMNRWLALFISAILFTLMHLGNEGINLLADFNIFIAGILLGVNFIYTKNLWFAIFLHFSWNFFQGSIIGFNVSGMKIDTGIMEIITNGPVEITGGSFGFEGSAFAAILQLIAIVALAMFYEKKYGKKLVKSYKKSVPVTASTKDLD